MAEVGGEDGFYVHVASTDSMDIFPENSASDFTNVLPRDISFSDVRNYEVSLAECSYNSSFYNVDENCAFGIFDFLYYWEKESPPSWGKLTNLKIPPGNYKNPETVCEFLNKLVDNANIPRLKNKQLFTYNQYTQKFSLNVKDLYVTLLVKGSLIDILGLERRHAVSNQIAYIGKSKDKHFYMYKDEKTPRYFKNQIRSWHSDAEQGGRAPFCAQMTTVTAFLVYVDFVKDVIFGSKFSNILRTVAVRGLNGGERVVECFNKRMYVPLKYNTFNSISVQIRDFQNNHIGFNSGNLCLTFHFRKKPRS